jgi:3-hydroxyacyl-CoA dehydrogenase/3a,7a,12a-trihydroxy-5b-cholest-24-enoyl-CoA hydratase
VFEAIGTYVSQHPELIAKVGNVFTFQLKGPDSAWTLDLKNGAGSVTAGAAAKADCTLELTESDFLDMVNGKADPQKLYFGGKLKVAGNVMASQKLNFLTKLDRSLIDGAASAAPSGAAAASAASGSRSAQVFGVSGAYVAQHPELVAKVGNVFTFQLKGPDSAWTLDLKNGAGSVAEGAAAKADCTLELADADFLAMTEGKADPQKLYFGGKLKVTGNVMASQKLNFLTQIDPKEVAAKAPAQAASAAPDSSASGASHVPALVAALGKRLAENPGLAAEVGAVVQFTITGPDASFVADLASKSPSVKEGRAEKADATLRLSDEDLVALVKDPSRAGELFMHGQLKVDGNLQVAHRLGFLKQLL